MARMFLRGQVSSNVLNYEPINVFLYILIVLSKIKLFINNVNF